MLEMNLIVSMLNISQYERICIGDHLISNPFDVGITSCLSLSKRQRKNSLVYSQSCEYGCNFEINNNHSKLQTHSYSKQLYSKLLLLLLLFIFTIIFIIIVYQNQHIHIQILIFIFKLEFEYKFEYEYNFFFETG